MVEMSKSELNELESRICVIIEHMLKLEHLPHLLLYNRRIWMGTINRERADLFKLFDSHKPGLKPQINEVLVNKQYRDAAVEVSKQFPKHVFPRICPYAVEEVVGNEVFMLLKR